MAGLGNKKVIIIGEEDGIPSQEMASCVEASGADVVFSITEHIISSDTGSMDHVTQRKIKEIAEKFGPENVVAVIGCTSPDEASLLAETLTVGDPTMSGPLSGTNLGLAVYHIFELKDILDPVSYTRKIAPFEVKANVQALREAVSKIREKYSRHKL